MRNEKSEIKDKWSMFISGDDDAYGWIYTSYVQDLYQYGLCFTTDTELIKDCIQDLFVYIYANRKKIARLQSVKSYLLISLKHNLLHAISHNQLPLNENLKEEDTPFLLEKTVEESFINNESRVEEVKMVKSILSLLTSRQKEVIYYRFIQEMTIQEISIIMNMNYQSTQNLIQRALAKVREHYPNGLGIIILLFSKMI